MTVIYVAVGGALGALARYGLGVLVLRYWPGPLPLATWSVNLLGCFLIGLALPFVAQSGPAVRLFGVVGFLGAFTTFSTFSLETVVLWEEGYGGAAALNAVGSVVAGVLCVLLGAAAGRAVLGGGVAP